MNRLTTLALLLLHGFLTASAADISDPEAHYLADYVPGDTVQKLTLDVTGDGKPDVLFLCTEAHPDPVSRIADAQNNGTLSWKVYASDPKTAAFHLSQGIENASSGGQVLATTTVSMNLDQMHLGFISEINRYGFITTATQRHKSQENTTLIHATTWEGDHFKECKLTEFTAGEPNTLFAKYLAEDKRTRLALKKIKP